MENTLFKEDTEELICVARRTLLRLDHQSRFDAKDQSIYQECLEILRKHSAFLYYSAADLEDLSSVPMDIEMLGVIGDFSVLKSLLLAHPMHSLDQVFLVDRKTFLSWPRSSAAKWELWLILRQQILERRDELLHYDQVSHEKRVFPVLDVARSYTLAEKVDLMTDQYLSALKEYAGLHPNVQELVDRLCLVFEIGADTDCILEQLKVTGESLRQFKEKYLGQIMSGSLDEIPHLSLDLSLIQEIRDFEQQGPKYKSVAFVNEFFGCQDYRQTHIPVFLKMKKLFETDKWGTYLYFDQPYFLPYDESVEYVKTYVTSLMKVMGAVASGEIRPMNLEEILQHLGELIPDFNFERPIVLDLLHQHQWVENWMEEHVEYFQMRYIYLYDYQKIARIVYEEKKVNYERIEQIDRERSTAGKSLNNIRDNSIVSRKNYPWVCPSGVEGTLIYEETGKAPLSLLCAIRKVAHDYRMFTFSEMMAELSRMGYASILQEDTVRSYILRDCVSCLDDSRLFCQWDHLKDFPLHRWRGRNRFVKNRLGALAVKLLKEVEPHKLSVSELEQKLSDYLSEQGWSIDGESPLSYLRSSRDYKALIGIEQHDAILLEK